MIHKTTLTSRLVKNYLDPILCPESFVRKNLCWNRRRGQFVDVICIQRDSSGTAQKQLITGHLAICIPEFTTALLGRCPTPMTEADGIVRMGFGELVDNHSGKASNRWWDLTPGTLDSIGLELRHIVEKRSLLILNSLHDFSSIQQHLTRRADAFMKVAYYRVSHALLLWKLGRETECESIMASLRNCQELVQKAREHMKRAG